MKFKNKLLAIMPIASSMLLPITAFAETGYITSTESVDYNTNNPIETDKTNTDEETKVDVTVSQTSTFSVKIPKVMVLNGAVGQKNDADYEVTVSGNIASDEVVSVTPPSDFKMHDDRGRKADLTTTITQEKTRFVNQESYLSSKTDYKTEADCCMMAQEAGNTGFGTVTIPGNVEVHSLSAGSWTGVFNFDIKLSTVTFSD